MRILLCVLAATPIWAEYLRIEQTFGGMECASCARFVESRLAKKPGVESVSVDTKAGALLVILKPGNAVRLRQVVDLVQQSGFTPKETRVKARGTLVDGNALKLSPKESIAVADPDHLLRGLAAGREVDVEGVVRKPVAGGEDSLGLSKVSALP